ncbi:MAG: EF-hand domain-containing protein [Sphingomonadaceae bacterium]
MRKIALSISAAALAVGGIAYAQGGPERGPQGDVTRAEAQAKAEKMFDKMDVNHDGVLNQADREARMAERFDKIDTNHDGSISREEFMAAHQRMGPKGQRGEHRMGADGQRGTGERAGKRMHRGGKHHGRMGGMMLMRIADPNHTGTVTKQAFVNAALTMFDKADLNHDGTVTPAERKAAREAMKAKWQDRAKQWRAQQQAQPQG